MLIRAIKASGVVVQLQPTEFLKLAAHSKEPLIVMARGGFLSKRYQYMMGYKGLAFYTKARDPLQLPAGAEVVGAKSIWVPG